MEHHEPAVGPRRSYAIGYVLSLCLTAAAFLLVMRSALTGPALRVVVAALAVVQVGVHLLFFFHLDRSPGQRGTLVVLAYTAAVLAILIGASVWIMYHLNANMMMGQ